MAAAMPPPPPAPPLMRKESSTYTYELRGLFSGEEDAYVSASDKVIAKVAELAAADQYHRPDGQINEHLSRTIELMRDTLQMEDRTILTELTKTLEPMLNARRVSCINEFEKKYIDEVATIQKRNVEMEMEIPKLKKRLHGGDTGHAAMEEADLENAGLMVKHTKLTARHADLTAAITKAEAEVKELISQARQLEYRLGETPGQSEKASAELADVEAERAAEEQDAILDKGPASKFGRLVVVYSGGATVRSTASISSSNIGVIENGSCVEYLQVTNHPGNGTTTCDVRRFRIAPTKAFPSGGWVSEKSQSTAPSGGFMICQPMGEAMTVTDAADPASDPLAALSENASADGSAPIAPKVAEMMNLGIEREVCEAALHKHGGNMETAINYIFDVMNQSGGDAKLKSLAQSMGAARTKAIASLKANYLTDWVRAALHFSNNDPVTANQFIQQNDSKMSEHVLAFKKAVGEALPEPDDAFLGLGDYGKFAELLEQGVAVESVKEQMLSSGLDPSYVVQLDPVAVGGFSYSGGGGGGASGPIWRVQRPLEEQVLEWQGRVSALSAEAETREAPFAEYTSELTSLNTLLERSNSAKTRDEDHWTRGEGLAFDVSDAALQRLKARLEASRRELEDFVERPDPQFQYFKDADY
eukprot:CAMPEP_0182525530 /NCGR_PEP_ID=MMETSP1323-20130603/2547_1 /TAXON_ID=236787 /ORGANISM="Florenciella parvula, Strain RCC1693" /LENGTH=645 /DNA_ID=CAMNT_0024734251 /DNA_START=26 /DNA_END=1963 /DNA_ORIENTATION=-